MHSGLALRGVKSHMPASENLPSNVLWPCHFSRLLEPGSLRETAKGNLKTVNAHTEPSSARSMRQRRSRIRIHALNKPSVLCTTNMQSAVLNRQHPNSSGPWDKIFQQMRARSPRTPTSCRVRSGPLAVCSPPVYRYVMTASKMKKDVVTAIEKILGGNDAKDRCLGPYRTAEVCDAPRDE